MSTPVAVVEQRKYFDSAILYGNILSVAGLALSYFFTLFAALQAYSDPSAFESFWFLGLQYMFAAGPISIVSSWALLYLQLHRSARLVSYMPLIFVLYTSIIFFPTIVEIITSLF